jgi:hypothetical protein
MSILPSTATGLRSIDKRVCGLPQVCRLRPLPGELVTHTLDPKDGMR